MLRSGMCRVPTLLPRPTPSRAWHTGACRRAGAGGPGPTCCVAFRTRSLMASVLPCSSSSSSSSCAIRASRRRFSSCSAFLRERQPPWDLQPPLA